MCLHACIIVYNLVASQKKKLSKKKEKKYILPDLNTKKSYRSPPIQEENLNGAASKGRL
jgi:hypothetical protein